MMRMTKITCTSCTDIVPSLAYLQREIH
jgi:hypothetical protein